MMATAAVIKLEGAMTLETAAARHASALPAGSIVFDFSDITQVDSSALALLLAWIKRAKAHGTTVEFRALPNALLALAKLYGVDTLLPLAA